MKHHNLPDLFLNAVRRSPSGAALQYKEAGRYLTVTWSQYLERVVQYIHALQQSGIGAGDRVAIISENRPEWVYADLAVLSLGAVVVPIYPTSSVSEIEYILKHCGASAVFVSNSEQAAKLEVLLPRLADMRAMCSFDETSGCPNVLPPSRWNVQPDSSDPIEWYEHLIAGVKPSALATIIYTSGTTGPPKGVMLTHENFLINCYNAKEALPLTEKDVSLSFLPLSHVFERMAGHYLSILAGCCTAFAENLNTVPQNLIEVHPTVARAVPRFFEKMQAGIQGHIDSSPAPVRKIFHWALSLGQRRAACLTSHVKIPFSLALQYAIVRRLFFSRIYARLGGRIRFFVSGGAPLAKELGEFFFSIGILILEGYGLTETSPVISVNRYDRFKFGSVGPVMSDVRVRIAEDGEIMVAGPSIMKGYYEDEAATRETIRDGWLHTGDLGKLDEEGFLYVTGRKKDIIVTSGGKNIAPQNIENRILTHCCIAQIVLVGDHRKFVCALIVPDVKKLCAALQDQGITAAEHLGELVQMPAVHKLFRDQIDHCTRDLSNYERIKYFTLLGHEFSQKDGEMTLTQKIRRTVVAEHYKKSIDLMYQAAEQDADGARKRLFFLV